MESLFVVVILSLILNSSVNAINLGKALLDNITNCDKGTVIDMSQDDYTGIFNSYRQEFSKSNEALNIRELLLSKSLEIDAKATVRNPPSEQYFTNGKLVLYVRNPTSEMGLAYAHDLWLNPSAKNDEFYDPTPQGYYEKQLQFYSVDRIGCASTVYSCTQDSKTVSFKEFACYFSEEYNNLYGSDIMKRSDSKFPCNLSCFKVSEKNNNLCIQNSNKTECFEM